jgi:hypothetical protein
MTSLHERLARIQVRGRFSLLHAAVSALRSSNEAALDVRLEPDVHRPAAAGIIGLEALDAAYQVGTFRAAQLPTARLRGATSGEQ